MTPDGKGDPAEAPEPEREHGDAEVKQVPGFRANKALCVLAFRAVCPNTIVCHGFVGVLEEGDFWNIAKLLRTPRNFLSFIGISTECWIPRVEIERVPACQNPVVAQNGLSSVEPWL